MMRQPQLLIAGTLVGLSGLVLAGAPASADRVGQAAAPAQAPAAASASTEFAPYTESIPDTKVTFDMVPVKGGSFTMGSPANEAGRGDDEGPQVNVTVGNFWIGA